MKKLLGVLMCFLSTLAFGGVISSTPVGPYTTSVTFSPVGEQVSDSEAGGYLNSHHAFASYIGQVFTALPGLASSLEVNFSPSGCAVNPCDGLDFRVLIAELSDGIPTNVISESALYTFGTESGTFGTPVEMIYGGYLFGANQRVNLGGTDLVDGKQYAFILDFVSSADGLQGLGGLHGFLASEANVQGSVLGANFDLETGALDGSWWTTDLFVIDFKMYFEDGGVVSPELTSIRELPSGTSDNNSVPEPNSILLMLAAGICLIATKLNQKS